MPRLLLLSTTTGYQLRSFGAAAGDLGVELVYATDRCGSLDDPWRDSAVPVRFHDEEASVAAIVRAGAAQPIDGVLPVGDRPVVLAALVAEALGLRGNPSEAARAAAHKRLARERLTRAGLPAPSFVAATIGEDIEPLLARLSYPVVLKPVDLSGSRGVMRADDAGELRARWGRLRRLLDRPDVRVRRTGSERDVLIESFIPGREYAVEGLLTGGLFRPLAIFDKPDPLDGPFFEETVYVTPSAASRSTQQAIVASIGQAAAALGLRHGPVHAECRVNDEGVFVLEVAPRPIGGLCSRVLRFGPGGETSLEHLLLRHALGHDVERVEREPCAAAVMMLPIPTRGRFKDVRGLEDARAVRFVEEVVIAAKPGQLLEPLPEAAGYAGFVFARGPGAADVEEAVRTAHARLDFVIDAAVALISDR